MTNGEVPVTKNGSKQKRIIASFQYVLGSFVDAEKRKKKSRAARKGPGPRRKDRSDG